MTSVRFDGDARSVMMGGYPTPPPYHATKPHYHPEPAGAPPIQYYDQYGNPVQFPIVYAPPPAAMQMPLPPPAQPPQSNKPLTSRQAEGCLAGYYEYSGAG